MNVIFLPTRALHVLCAALWIGSNAALGVFVLPALARLGKGPEAARAFAQLLRSPLHGLMASTGGLTILSGLYLYWHLTAGLDPTIIRSASGLTYGAGAILGIIAGGIGGRIGASMKKLEAAAAPLATSTDAGAIARLGGEFEQRRVQLTVLGRAQFAFQLVAIILMALGHYV